MIRNAARANLVSERQIALGQYFTPIWVARLMAEMCEVNGNSVRVLDPGAGAGTLFTALAAHILTRGSGRRPLSITAFELDLTLRPFLERSAQAVRRASDACHMLCDIELRQDGLCRMGHAVRLGRPVFRAPEVRRGHTESAVQETERWVRLAKTARPAGNRRAKSLRRVPRTRHRRSQVRRCRRRDRSAELLQRYLFQAIPPVPAGFRHDQPRPPLRQSESRLRPGLGTPGERCSGVAEATRQGVPCVAIVQCGQRNRSPLEPAGPSG